MSYVINKTDGTVITTIADGTTNTQTGLTLIGRNYPSYGEIQNENFLKLLESFADNVPPTTSALALVPLAGTVWYDNGTNRLRVYDGTNWSAVSERIVANSAPTTSEYTIKAGDQWYSPVAEQLFAWTGSTWGLIGPSYTSGQGKSGSIVETVTDTQAINHTVVNTYTNGNLISVSSFDSEFTPIAPLGNKFTTIRPGVNLLSNVVLAGNATNSLKLGNVLPESYARVDQDNTFVGNISVDGSVHLTNANIFYISDALRLQNYTYQGNVDVYVNSSSGTINAFHIDGDTGLATVYADPVMINGVATKGYIDDSLNAIIGDIENVAHQFYANLEQLQEDYIANVIIVTNALIAANAALAESMHLVNGNVTTLSNTTADQFSNVDATTTSLQDQIYNIDAFLANVPTIYAPKISPTFSGTPIAPTPAVNDSSTKIATTAFVTLADGVLTTDYTTRIANEVTARNAAISAAIAPLANIASPAFTGSPTAPTPTQGDNSTKIATTAFVKATVENNKFNYTVSSSPPSGGNNGDFWFQIG